MGQVILTRLLIITWLVGMCQYTHIGKRIPNFAGPFWTIVRRVTNESSAEYNSSGVIWSELHFMPAEPGQPQYRWGYTYVGNDITDQLKIEIRMALWANNQWEKNALVMKFDHACSGIHQSRSLAQLVLGSDLKCPFSRGKIILPNESFETSYPHVRVFPYGRYRFDLLGLNYTQVLTAYTAIIDLVPKL